MSKKTKKKKPKPKSWYGKAWWFIWHDDSSLSWLVNIVIAVILIKFVIYPGLGLILGTEYPIVAVVSNSMDHNDNFDQWWSKNKNFYLEQGITKEMFLEYPFNNGFNKGDLMVLTGISKEKIQKGEVVVFLSKKPYPIIHRVVAVENTYFETKGDGNKAQIAPPFDNQLNEKNISYDSLVGRAVFRIPLVGYVKILAADFLSIFGINIG